MVQSTSTSVRGRIVILASLAVLIVALPARAEVGPPDVYARVAQLQAEIHLIQAALGAQGGEPLGLQVTGAAPREVHFQAVTLFAKADQLSFEQARKRGSAPSVASSGSPADVLAVVDRAGERIAVVKERLGILEASPLPARDASRRPTDVFLLLVATNRQLNQLLRRRFEPRDVYAQVTLAVGYAARLLSRFDGAVRIPSPPAFEPEKIPADVFEELATAYVDAAAILEVLGHSSLALDTTLVDRPGIAPSDVYDIARLTLSQLVFLHGQIDGLPLPLDGYDPGPMAPSDVFQRVGILQAQLRELRRHVVASPERVRAGAAP